MKKKWAEGTTDSEVHSRHASWRANHDALTRLINRRAFAREGELLLNNAKMTRNGHALLLIDLDRFKAVNDQYGHPTGDAALRRIASVIAGEVRESDTVARVGGNEFGVLLRGCSTQQAQRCAASLIRAVSKHRVRFQRGQFTLSIRIGLVSVTAHSAGLRSLLSAAERACRVAREKGGGCLHVSEPTGVETRNRRQEVLIARLNNAMDAGLHEYF